MMCNGTVLDFARHDFEGRTIDDGGGTARQNRRVGGPVAAITKFRLYRPQQLRELRLSQAVL
jgi:hypothetical protein